MENKEIYLAQLSDMYADMKSRKRSHNALKRTMAAARNYNDRRTSAISALQPRIDQFITEKTNNGFAKGEIIKEAYRGKVTPYIAAEATMLHANIMSLYTAGEATSIDVQRAQLLMTGIIVINNDINNDDSLFTEFINESSFNTEDANQLSNYAFQKAYQIGYDIQFQELRILENTRKLLMAGDIWNIRRAELESEISNNNNLIDQLDPQSPSYQADLQNYQENISSIQVAISNSLKEYEHFSRMCLNTRGWCFDVIQQRQTEFDAISGFGDGRYAMLGLPDRPELELIRGKHFCFGTSIADFFTDFSFDLFGTTYTLNI